MSSGVDIVVVGSVNVDLSVVVERFPNPGETVTGHSLLQGGGGKGANQAVAAARLGRRVAMVGAVGDDTFGRFARQGLADAGIVLDHLRVVAETETGLALIEVSPEGENRIVVVAGANALVSPMLVERAEPLLAGAGVILTQFEIPTETVETLARHSGPAVLVVNPAPARADVELAGADIVVPNRSELALLTGDRPDALDGAGHDELVDRCRALPGRPPTVIVTLGADGALVVESPSATGSGAVTPVAALDVAPVDTTAAGDAFCGGLADAISRGATMVEAARWASRVSAVTITRRGAQESLPTRSEVEAVPG